VGLVVNLMGSADCCDDPALPLILQMFYGIVAAAAALTLTVAVAGLVSRRPSWALVLVGLLVALLVGGLLGPLAYALPHPMLAMFVCALLGAVLAFLLAWHVCPRCTPSLSNRNPS
jgi:uncharacterized membrane protein YccC